MNDRVRCFVLVLWLCGGSSVTHGEFVIEVGNHSLLPDAEAQPIDLLISSDSDTDPLVNGMNLRVRLGDGSGLQGVFQGVEGSATGVVLNGGGFLWDRGPAGSSIGGEAPISGAPAFAEISVNLNNSGTTQNVLQVDTGMPVKVATLMIDTSGLLSGTYAIDLTDSLGAGIGRTNLIGSAGAELNLSITNGSFTVTSVPEPSSFLTVGLISIGAVILVLLRNRGMRCAAPVSGERPKSGLEAEHQ